MLTPHFKLSLAVVTGTLVMGSLFSPSVSSAAPAVYPAGGDCPGGEIPSFHPRIYVSKVYHHPKQRLVTGTWNFPDCWAGQTKPIDSAAIRSDLPRCYRMKSFHAETYDVNFASTGLASMRDVNVGSNSPIWNIHDQTVGFNDQADSGAVSVIFVRKCRHRHHNLGAEFSYQATEGGSVNGVSASWENFSVSTSGTELKRKNSSKPTYFTL